MAKAEPTIQKFMSTQPLSIDAAQTVAEAVSIMGDKKIKHLPVMKNDQVYGILTESDIKTAMAILGSSEKDMAVGDICHEHPYQVEPDSKLHDVVNEMAAHHYGSALIVQNNKLVGIFTAVDACRAISKILEQRFHEH